MLNSRTAGGHFILTLLLMTTSLACIGNSVPVPSPETLVWLQPAPRTENGRFANPVGELLRGTNRVRISFMWRRIKATLRPRPGAPGTKDSGTAHYRAAVQGETAQGAWAQGTQTQSARIQDAATVTWIGHATLLVEMDGVRFLTDPIWSKRASPISWMGPARRVEPGIPFEDLPKIDFVLISHNHFDHLDLPTLERIAQRDPEVTFYVPLGNAKLLLERGITRVVELDWTQQATLHGVEIHCLPAQHWSKRSLTDTYATLWSSWAVIGPERRFFFAGDTGYFTGFKEIGEALGPFDLAAVPIGAYEPTEMMDLSHMNPEQAVLAAIDVDADTAVAIHFGTFDLADEPLDEPPKRFIQAAAGEGSASLEAWVLSVGELRQF